jgi:hypothetical protein
VHPSAPLWRCFADRPVASCMCLPIKIHLTSLRALKRELSRSERAARTLFLSIWRMEEDAPFGEVGSRIKMGRRRRDDRYRANHAVGIFSPGQKGLASRHRAPKSDIRPPGGLPEGNLFSTSWARYRRPMRLLYREHSIPQFAFYSVLGAPRLFARVASHERGRGADSRACSS